MALKETVVTVPSGNGVALEGALVVPSGARGIVLFAHGSGSSRHSPRNRFVASALHGAGLGTVLLDLLTPEEESIDVLTARHRFDIELLARRIVAAIDWLRDQPGTRDLAVGLYGSSTGGGAALVAAATRPDRVRAVVSRGGRPDLAGGALPRVRAATLLIVGGNDPAVLELNRGALGGLRSETRLEIVAGATHLFEERGALDQVAALTRGWFEEHLGGAGARHAAPAPAP